MKQLIQILLSICFISYGNIAFAEFYTEQMKRCNNNAGIIAEEYIDKAEAQEIDEDSLSTEEQKKEARIRNMCLSSPATWVQYYEYGKCGKFPDIEKKSGGIIVSQLNKWKKINCLSDDIDIISSAIQDLDDMTLNILFGDMNFATQSILKDEETLFMIIIRTNRCYETDDNGDTVWHAFAKKKRFDWADACVASLDEDMDNIKELAKSMYKIKDKNGKTALQLMLEKDKNTNLLSAVSEVYGHKGGNVACDELAKDIADSNDINISKAKSLINKCYK